MDYINYNINQVSCIDRQIAELEARRNTLINGYCYTVYHEAEPFVDPYHLYEDKHEEQNQRQ